jgi:hypothetical protein
MTSDVRVIFALGARLHMSAAAVERLSAREVAAWVDYFTPGAEDVVDDGVPEVRNLTRDELRAMFRHG